MNNFADDEYRLWTITLLSLGTLQKANRALMRTTETCASSHARMTRDTRVYWVPSKDSYLTPRSTLGSEMKKQLQKVCLLVNVEPCLPILIALITSRSTQFPPSCRAAPDSKRQ